MTTSLFVLCLLLSVNAQSDEITIDTQLGSITGVIQNDYVTFKGIRYTEFAPIGNNRFRESVVKTSSYPNTSSYDATQFKSVCMQNFNISSVMDEDCLFLNIWTPNININNASIVGDLLPVLFWIHGGGFRIGTSAGSVASNLLYDGKTFMSDKDVIYVSINYRLGNLGFLSLETILKENGKTTGGMNGINDIIVALQWVENNIIDYGGDSNQVTIFGESAGGTAVCMLLAMQFATDLFDKAIIQSGACIGAMGSGLHLPYEVGLELAHNALINANLNDDLETLRSLDAVTLTNLDIRKSTDAGGAAVPAVDNYFIFNTVLDIYMNNLTELNTDEIIVGFNNMDTYIGYPLYWANIEAPTNDEELTRYLEAYIDNTEYIDMIQDIYYPITDFPSYTYNGELIANQTMLWYSMNADVCFNCDGMRMAQLLDNQERNVYLYNFRGPTYPYYIPHGAELPFLFNQSDAALFTYETSWSYELSYYMTETWKNYAIHGIPNSTVYPDGWTPFAMNGTGINIQDLNAKFEPYYFDNYRNGVCDFWLNQVGENITFNLCVQTIGIIDDEGEEYKLETWAIVLIVIGSTIIVIVAAVLLWRYCISSKPKGDYSKMQANEMPSYGAT